MQNLGDKQRVLWPIALNSAHNQFLRAKYFDTLMKSFIHHDSFIHSSGYLVSLNKIQWDALYYLKSRLSILKMCF